MRLRIVGAGVLIGLAMGAGAAIGQVNKASPPVVLPTLKPLVPVTPKVAPATGARPAGQAAISGVTIKDGQIPVQLILRDGMGSLPYGFKIIPWNMTERKDQDGDDADAVGRGGTDCNDADPQMYPGHVEVADPEGRDGDCNPATVGALDLDHDGILSWKAFEILRGGSGQAYYMIRGADCDDNDPQVSPLVPEVPGNNIDDNCDGIIDRFDRVAPSDYCGPASVTGLSDPKQLMCTPGRR